MDSRDTEVDQLNSLVCGTLSKLVQQWFFNHYTSPINQTAILCQAMHRLFLIFTTILQVRCFSLPFYTDLELRSAASEACLTPSHFTTCLSSSYILRQRRHKKQFPGNLGPEVQISNCGLGFPYFVMTHIAQQSGSGQVRADSSLSGQGDRMASSSFPWADKL